MTEHEINRAVQYVTAATSYGRDTVDDVVRTCLAELGDLAAGGPHTYTRDVLMEYVCQWTMKRTGQPEPLVREILGCAGRWLDDLCAEAAARRATRPDGSDEEGNGLTNG